MPLGRTVRASVLGDVPIACGPALCLNVGLHPYEARRVDTIHQHRTISLK